MKSALLILFVFFSLLSSMVESAEVSESCSSVEEHAVLKLHCNSEKHPVAEAPAHSHTCHDSNCYGSAHFGHGYYYPQKSFSKIEIQPGLLLGMGLANIQNSRSSVFLDGPFRPPLFA